MASTRPRRVPSGRSKRAPGGKSGEATQPTALFRAPGLNGKKWRRLLRQVISHGIEMITEYVWVDTDL